MTNKPVVFISATSDLCSARGLVGQVLSAIGFEPKWQDIAPTDGGEMLDVLRRWIEPAEMVIQLVGRRYGAEPPEPTKAFGRVSYTQFEALEAERLEKKVIYLCLDDSYCPVDSADPEPPELASLQAQYCQGLRHAQRNRLCYDRIAEPKDLELSIHKLRDELAALRRLTEGRYRKLARLGVAAVVGIAIVAVLVFAIFHLIDKQAAELADLRKAFDVVAAAVGPKPPAAGQTHPDAVPQEVLAKARSLLEFGNGEQQALGMIALKQYAAADRLIQQLKSQPDNPIDEAARLLTLEGDNWYRANEPDKAIEPYDRVFALKPKDFQARNRLVITLISARLGDVAAQRQRAIDIGRRTLDLVPPRSADWAMTQENIAIASSRLPTGDRAKSLDAAIAACREALTFYTKDAYPVDWANTQRTLGNTLRDLSTGDRTENLEQAIDAYQAALTVYRADVFPALRLDTETDLSWAQLLAKDFAGALATAGRPANEGSVFLPLEVNRAHALLLLGRTDEAKAIYQKHIGEKIAGTDKTWTWEQFVRNDFDALESSGIDSSEFAKVRQLLERAVKTKRPSGQPATATPAGEVKSQEETL